MRLFRLFGLGGSVALLLSCGVETAVTAIPPQVEPADVTECGFTPIGGSSFQSSLFQRYDCNPVFEDSGEAWANGVASTGFHAEQVLGHPFYQLWYSAETANGYDLGYAVSADGTQWDPTPLNPLLPNTPPSWRASRMDAITVVWDSDQMQYVMSFQGLNFQTGENGLGMMTSSDGLSWSALNADRPVVDLTVDDGGDRYCWPITLTHTPGQGLQGYLAGGSGTTDVLNADGSPAGGVTTKCELQGINAATALDFNSNTPTYPVLSAGPTGSYDGAGMASAAVAYLEDAEGQGVYYMFYSGIESFRLAGNQNFVEAYDTTLNVATSLDGVNWTKSPDNPILEIQNTPNRGRILGIAAQTVGPRIHLWVNDAYSGDRAVGYFLYEPNPIEPAPAPE